MRYRVSNITPGLYLCTCAPTPENDILNQVAALLGHSAANENHLQRDRDAENTHVLIDRNSYNRLAKLQQPLDNLKHNGHGDAQLSAEDLLD